MTSIRSTMKANVARGVALLDEKDPHWWNGKNTPPVVERMVGHINLEKLDMSNPDACILGQRGGPSADHHYETGYEVGIKELLIINREEQASHGFEADTFEDVKCSEQYSILTELWASVIQSRRFPRRKIAEDPWVKRVNKTWVRR